MTRIVGRRPARPTSYSVQMCGWFSGGDRPRLALEALAQRRDRGDSAAGSTLIATVAIEPRVARAIHLAHAARAERREDLVGAETRTGGETHKLR